MAAQIVVFIDSNITVTWNFSTPFPLLACLLACLLIYLFIYLFIAQRQSLKAVSLCEADEISKALGREGVGRSSCQKLLGRGPFS